jgi:hypothetical protein
MTGYYVFRFNATCALVAGPSKADFYEMTGYYAIRLNATFAPGAGISKADFYEMTGYYTFSLNATFALGAGLPKADQMFLRNGQSNSTSFRRNMLLTFFWRGDLLRLAVYIRIFLAIALPLRQMSKPHSIRSDRLAHP